MKIDINKFQEYDYDWEDLKIKDDEKLCIFCEAKLKYSRGLCVCVTCRKDLTITKTTVLKEYMLKSEHLEDLHCIQYKNEYGYTHLYLLKEIRETAIFVHYKIICTTKMDYMTYTQMLIDKRSNKNELNKINREKLKTRKYYERQNRRKILEKKLNKYKLKIREDSEYCNKYINENKYTVGEVVDMMVIMDFLYKRTDYPQRIRKLYEYNKKCNQETINDRKEYGITYDSDDILRITEHDKQKLKKKAIQKYIKLHGKNKIPDQILVLCKKYK
ncbi:hypothetical protein QLL95_gp0312 [Cotonvirus japonicus]|uniref:Uncharacterized protein n=1 Tax=Cotonvirus japonicus TaxID=2811091 RepID=A0ABM7NRM0_9VIRU|nr:hypothetical protein QLL95_gp0312 [Cotonvirus japonicus]BCS82801.1 hypothetical protein [Cotonvirus japonicus]